MFLEQIAVLTLQVRAKLRSFLNYLLPGSRFATGPDLFYQLSYSFNRLLYYTWVIPVALWIKISFTLIYLIASLLCVSALYFIIKGKRIKNNSKVYSLDEPDLENFQDFNLEVIPLTEEQVKTIFKAFSDNFLSGKYQSFQSLNLLKPITHMRRNGI